MWHQTFPWEPACGGTRSARTPILFAGKPASTALRTLCLWISRGQSWDRATLNPLVR